jgi:hypothetical protein
MKPIKTDDLFQVSGLKSIRESSIKTVKVEHSANLSTVQRRMCPYSSRRSVLVPVPVPISQMWSGLQPND